MSGITLTIVLLAAILAAVVGLLLSAMRRFREHDARLERMERMAMTDELTGLPNRRSWDEQLQREIARADRHQHSLFVAMLDLDRFKAFNDAGGHQAGDRLLTSAAGSWRSALRPYDLLARYGGEEFSLVLSGCTATEAAQVVERLRAAVPEDETCSVGLAEWDRLESPQKLVARADAALYEAKATGRDRLVSSVPQRPRRSERQAVA
jgi:diguanylate cyclase (GGDEF)-like protein